MLPTQEIVEEFAQAFFEWRKVYSWIEHRYAPRVVTLLDKYETHPERLPILYRRLTAWCENFKPSRLDIDIFYCEQRDYAEFPQY